MPLPARTSKYLFWGLNGLLGVAFLGELCAPGFSSGWDQATIALAAAASLAALHRQLPWQNILPAALITAAAGGLAHAMSAKPNLALPFGPVVFYPAGGGKLFDAVPWTVPLLWVVAIFNARGTVRLSLRPWRKVKNYGFWLMGLTVLLAVAFDLALEPFAGPVMHLWRWQPTKIAVTWYGATPLNFLGWAFVAVLIMAFATPSLIRKQPGNPSAPDFHPLVMWLGALLLFAAGSARAGLWWSFGLDAVLAAVTAYFANLGARW